MELTNDFQVALPVERAWAVLTDLERIAPCMPGAQLQEIEGDEYRGIVKIKVGPITAQYKGKATFLSRDTENHVAVLRAEGRETRGQGNANATITATLTPDDGGTAVRVATDLTITGRVAQFGRGVMADVSAKLLDQFVDNLETTVLAGDPVEAVDAELKDSIEGVQPDPGPSPAPDSPIVRAEPESKEVRRVDAPEAEPVDLLSAAGSPVARRVAPVLAVLAVLWVLRKLLSRSRD